MMNAHDIVVIGGGPAGLSAAVAARDAGIQDILIVERNHQLGGILNQCIHNGFGLHAFKEELTGPEYAQRYIDMVTERHIPVLVDTMVLDVQPHQVTYINREEGVVTISAKAIILAMGCRERPRGALNIPGYRPAGIYSAGTAQRLMNIEGCKVGSRVVILGSGDIGLIMARRMTLEGAKVKVVAELMPFSGGLKRNIVQCLDDYGIPLLLSHTVVDIEGRRRVEAVTIAEVDEGLRPIAGTEVRHPCDTLMLSVGLLPENELSRSAGVELSAVTRGPVVDQDLQTSVPGIFACGNVLHVHDLVDFVSQEAAVAGLQAARYARGPQTPDDSRGIPVVAAEGVRYTVPSHVDPDRMGDSLTVRFRVDNEYRDRHVSVYLDDRRVQHRRRRIMAPGEMEQVVLRRPDLLAHEGLSRITVKLEEA